MSGTLLPRPEQLMDMVGSAAAVKLAMEGAFDARIKELKEAAAALDGKTKIVSTLDEAIAIRDKAIADAAKSADASAALAATARSTFDSAKSREATIASREQAVASREAAADRRQSGQDAREQAIAETQSNRSAELLSREQALEENEADYAIRKRLLEADIRAFNQKLEALKV